MIDKDIKHEDKKARRKSRHGFWAGIVLGGLLGAAIAGGFLFAGSQAVAAGSLMGGMGHFRHHGPPVSPEVAQERADFAIDFVLSRVDASDDQKEQIKAIVGSSIADLFPLVDQHKTNREAFVVELSNPTIDRDALEQLRKNGLDMADQASTRLVSTIADAAEVLTPEQRSELIELARKFHER
jgi:Spy/CpxP family protein refolding chaperone